MAHASAEMLDALPSNLTTFENAEQYDEPVLVEGVPLRSLCEHPMLPFSGIARSATCAETI
jgi:GTP cyclohydrolase I